MCIFRKAFYVALLSCFSGYLVTDASVSQINEITSLFEEGIFTQLREVHVADPVAYNDKGANVLCRICSNKNLSDEETYALLSKVVEDNVALLKTKHRKTNYSLVHLASIFDKPKTIRYLREQGVTYDTIRGPLPPLTLINGEIRSDSGESVRISDETFRALKDCDYSKLEREKLAELDIKISEAENERDTCEDIDFPIAGSSERMVEALMNLQIGRNMRPAYEQQVARLKLERAMYERTFSNMR